MVAVAGGILLALVILASLPALLRVAALVLPLLAAGLLLGLVLLAFQ